MTETRLADPLEPAAGGISLEDQLRLLALARRCLEAQVLRQPPPAPGAGGVFDVPAGAFVSIHAGNDLRGCLGRIEATLPLAHVVAHLASVVGAADPRFPPLAPQELASVRLEISVLTEARDIAPEDVEVGRHGLIAEQGPHRGLLLPQVAVAYRWDRITFIEHTCVKAGLPRDAWRRGARLLAFDAQVFGEDV